MNNRLTRILFAFVTALVTESLLIILFQVAETGSWMQRLTMALGGDLLGGGYIQALTYFAFFWGLLEVRWFSRFNNMERKFFSYEILPEDEFSILDANLLNKVRIKMADYLRQHKGDTSRRFYLLRLINKACTKFRANLSVSETFQLVNSQCRINAAKADSEHSFIRYVVWAIPALGFIGTVLGISQALAIANSGDINQITTTLGLAFDTTLLALLLSLVLMLFVHQLQKDTEELHTDIEEYVLDKLVNRIDVD